jgi:hypothetical protein
VLPAYKPPRHYSSSPLLGAPANAQRAYLAFFRWGEACGLGRAAWGSR